MADVVVDVAIEVVKEVVVVEVKLYDPIKISISLFIILFHFTINKYYVLSS